MPKQIIDYSKTIIYKLVCNDLEITDIYVGQTTNFIKRRQYHKSKCNNKNSKAYNLLVYETIRNNGGFENWSMVMVEEINCNNKLEALARERYWIETLKSNLNKQFPTRTLKEWNEQNKEYLKEYKKEYYEENKEYIKEQYEQNKEKQRQKFNCECGGKFTHEHKATHLKTKKHLKSIII